MEETIRLLTEQAAETMMLLVGEATLNLYFLNKRHLQTLSLTRLHRIRLRTQRVLCQLFMHQIK